MHAQDNTPRAHSGDRVNGVATWGEGHSPSPPVGPPLAAAAAPSSTAPAPDAASRASARRRRVAPVGPAKVYIDVDDAERTRLIRRGQTYSDGVAIGKWTAEALAARIRERSCPRHVREAMSRALATAPSPQKPCLSLPEKVSGWSPALQGCDDEPHRPHPPKAVLRVADYIARCPRSQFDSTHPPLALWTWERGHPETATRHVCVCGSWRCDGCAPRAASIAFARIREALAPFDARDVVFAVLTLDQLGRYSGERWHSVDDVYRDVSRRTRNFLRRINRWCERLGVEGPGSRWVATVEAHRSGWPHLNIVMVAPGLARIIEAHRDAALALGGTATQATLMWGEALTHALAAGWGPRSTMDVARSSDAVGGYIVKLAKLHDAAVGEIAKLTQRPDVAPKGTHRIRSGLGFLPPRRKSELTGALIASYRGPTGPVAYQYGRPSVLDKTTLERWATRTAEADDVVMAEIAYLESEFAQELDALEVRVRSVDALEVEVCESDHPSVRKRPALAAVRHRSQCDGGKRDELANVLVAPVHGGVPPDPSGPASNSDACAATRRTSLGESTSAINRPVTAWSG